MDRIEAVAEQNARENHPVQQPSESTSTRPPLATLRAPGSMNRVRRPSIRLTRLPSASSLDTVNKDAVADQLQNTKTEQPQAGPSLTRQVSIRSPVAEEDESWHGGRRRSNSEPRPGRWSSPPPHLVSRVGSSMFPLSEESSRHGSLQQGATAQDTSLSDSEQHAPEHLAPPEPALQRPASRLRRSSQAALNRFSRNRASTVTGVPPTISMQKTKQQEQAENEYGPHVVDVLDVIGKIIQTNAIQRPGC